MNLNGKVAVITGAGSGLGSKLAAEFVTHDAKVVLVGRHVNKLEDVKKKIDPSGNRLLIYPGDVVDPNYIVEMRQYVLSMWGKVDILVNNAAVLPWSNINDCSMDEFESAIDVNYLGAVRLVKAFLPQMRTSKGAVIVNIGSFLAWVPTRGSAAYAASKSALLAFTKVLRMEELDSGVHVLDVGPGLMDTPMAVKFYERNKIYRRLAVSPELVAKAIVNAIDKRQKSLKIPWYVKPGVILSGLAPEVVSKLTGMLG